MKRITLDLREIRSKLEQVEANMRLDIVGAEKRLGFSAVMQAMRLLTEAQSKLQDLEALTNPMPRPVSIETDLYM